MTTQLALPGRRGHRSKDSPHVVGLPGTGLSPSGGESGQQITVTTPIRAPHDLSAGSPAESCWTRQRRSGPCGPCWATSACTGEVQTGVAGALAHASGSRKAGWFMAAEHGWVRVWAGRRTAGCLQTPGLPMGRSQWRVVGPLRARDGEVDHGGGSQAKAEGGCQDQKRPL